MEKGGIVPTGLKGDSDPFLIVPNPNYSTTSMKRFTEIQNGIAITQGIYNKVQSPLFVQTFLGRSVLQFGRWKITNAALFRRIIKQAKAEWAKDNFTGEGSSAWLTGCGISISKAQYQANFMWIICAVYGTV